MTCVLFFSCSALLRVFFLMIFFQGCLASSLCCIPVTIIIETKEWAEEIAWQTFPESEAFSLYGVYDDFAVYEHDYCLPSSTTYTFVALDEYADGWHGGTYSVLVNGTKVLGPTVFSDGHIFAEEKFTTCACSCDFDCLLQHRSCCVNESNCGQCLPGYSQNEEGECKETELLPWELETWKIIFNATKGWEWSECNTEKSYNNPCASCVKVSCQFHQYKYTIVGLTLNDLGLSGSIPPEIFYLQNLTVLELGMNRLSGTIPDGVSNLVHLEVFSLYSNSIIGTIPRELSLLENLNTLDLSFNEFSGSIPKDIFKLVNLQVLFLSSNRLTGSIPSEISQAHNLVLLYLYLNQISGTIPLGLYQLTNLQELLIFSNQLGGTISPQIAQLTNLNMIYAGNNNFEGTIPGEVALLTNLQVLSLFSNKLTGTIPSLIAQLTNLLFLSLFSNQLSGTISPELFNLPKIRRLILRSNQLTGTIPTEIPHHSNVEWLYLHSNQLTGTIPPELSRMTGLEELSLSSNYLFGTIPEQIFQLSNLKILELHSNLLNGTIPSEISNLANIQILKLHSNKLTGSIPRQMLQLVDMQILDIHSNKFTGPIPPKISNLSVVEYIDFSHNQLNDTIPASLGELNTLITLDISHNRFVGTLPFEWNDREVGWVAMNVKHDRESPYFKQLRQFKACCNQFTGHLRDFVGPFLTVNNLVQLDLSQNQIEGSFTFWPGIWFDYTVISGLVYSGLGTMIICDLSFNKITQQLPQNLPSTLSIFFITNNTLTGSIPDTYSQLFIFNSQNNKLRSNKLPSFFEPNGQWADLKDHDGDGVECKGFATNDETSKVFDIQPVYDDFSRCQCKAGYFKFQSNSSITKPVAKCEKAPLGYYTSTRNRFTQAIPCPTGHFSNLRASTQCSVCMSNTFSLVGQSACLPCPTRAHCADGVISLKQNSWMHPLRVLNESIKDEHIYNCLNDKACIVNGSNVRCAWELGYDNSSVLCSECLGGFYSTNRMTKNCEECTQAITTLTIVASIFILFLGLKLVYKNLLRAQIRRLSSSSDLGTEDETHSRFQSIIDRIICLRYIKKCTKMLKSIKFNPDSKGIVRVFIGHVQVLAIFADLQLRGPRLFHSVTSSSVGIIVPNLSPATFKCSFNIGFDASVLIASSVPIILFAMLIIMALVVSIKVKSNKSVIFRSILTAFVFFFYLVHPSVMRQLLQTFHFHWQVIEGQHYLQSDMFITRSSTRFLLILVVSIIGVILYGIVAPAAAALHLAKDGRLDPSRSKKLQSSHFQQEFGFLYQGYRLNGALYLWELAIYLRKTLLLLLAVFLGHDNFLQAYLASLVLIIAHSAHNRFQPYRSVQLNQIESLSLAVLVLTQMSLLLISHYDKQMDDDPWGTWISMVLVFLNGAFFALLFQKLVKGTTKSDNSWNKRSDMAKQAQIVPDEVIAHKKQESASKLVNQCHNLLHAVEDFDLKEGNRDEEMHKVMEICVDFMSELQIASKIEITITKPQENEVKSSQDAEILNLHKSPHGHEIFQSEDQESLGATNIQTLEKDNPNAESRSSSVAMEKELIIKVEDSIHCVKMNCIGKELHEVWHWVEARIDNEAEEPHQVSIEIKQDSDEEQYNIQNGDKEDETEEIPFEKDVEVNTES